MITKSSRDIDVVDMSNQSRGQNGKLAKSSGLKMIKSQTYMLKS